MSSPSMAEQRLREHHRNVTFTRSLWNELCTSCLANFRQETSDGGERQLRRFQNIMGSEQIIQKRNLPTADRRTDKETRPVARNPAV